MMRLTLRHVLPLLAAVALVSGGAGCTDANVFETPGVGSGRQDNKLEVVGAFCTEHPDELNFPVKIMFIIDCSQSMIITDPPPSPNEYPGRVRSIWEVIQQFRHDPGVEFAVLRFEAAANVATQEDTNGDGIADRFGFVNDLPSLLRALNSLIAAGGNTSYQAALGLAEATLAMDMSTANVDERARTKYVVIFLSDGLPYPQDFDDDVNTPASIKQALREMMNLPKRFDVNDFTFHTAYLSVNTPEYVAVQAESLLKDMADIGGGTYRNFENGEEINFLDIDYTSIKRMYALKDGAFLVSDVNARPAWSRAESIDTDGDGLIDQLEEQLGTSVGRNDTDGDGFNDKLEHNLRRSGFDPLDPDDADCSLALDKLDRDGDGLLDCEERFIGTSEELFDTDSDGIPDPVEFRSGTNPVWGDADVDMDFDGSLNGQETAWHTNPTDNDAADFSKLAYRYRMTRDPGIFESRTCYHFEVDNISLVGTAPRSLGAPEGYNDIMVYVGQVPQDDPLDEGTFRVACARVRYIPRYPEPDIKYPPSGRVEFVQRDFKRPVATRCGSDEECPHHVCDPREHTCLAPLGGKCDEATPCPHFTCVQDFAGNRFCEYPVQVTCLEADDCPPFPVDPATSTCMDPARTAPDEQGLCPRRICIPVYTTCSGSQPCPPDQDGNPVNDPVCLGGFCRAACIDASDCNPGETCDADTADEYGACLVAADCPTAGMDCLDGACRTPCLLDSDCPGANDSCESELCVSNHCVNHQGGSCEPVGCAADTDCPLQTCDPEVSRCRIQPCLDSRECPHQHCEQVLGFCLGSTCELNVCQGGLCSVSGEPCETDAECNPDVDCRGERGYTCNEVVGDPCDRDIDCPFDFCTEEIKECFYDSSPCQSNLECTPNTCPAGSGIDCSADPGICAGGLSCVDGVCQGTCSLEGNACGGPLDCSPNYCRSFFTCGNDPTTGCTMSLDCPQTFCKADGTCMNNPGTGCNPATENIDNACQVGMCARNQGMGACDTAEHEPCTQRTECPEYHCNLSLNLCYYPTEVACAAAADCPEPGMECDATGFCIKRCNSDADCPHARCQGRCVPYDPGDHMRCTDWFDPERDCKRFDDEALSP